MKYGGARPKIWFVPTAVLGRNGNISSLFENHVIDMTDCMCEIGEGMPLQIPNNFSGFSLRAQDFFAEERGRRCPL